MMSLVEDDFILNKIKKAIPVINIDEWDLSKFDDKSPYLYISNYGLLSIENLLSGIQVKIQERFLRNITKTIIIIFMTTDIGEKIKVNDFKNLIFELPNKGDIIYGIYLLPESKNSLEIFYILKNEN